MKPPTNPSVCCRRSERGGALLYALVISFFGVVLVTSLGTYFSSLTKTVLKNNDIGALRAALHSSMDYTLNGIRNRWCFTPAWMINGTCALTDPNNVERLLISDEALRAIEQGMPVAAYGGDISKVRTKSFTGTIKWADITEEHPLYYAVKGLQDIGKDFTFNFKVIRVDNGAQKGREVLLQVQVELVLGGQSLIKTSSGSITAVSSVMIFPREINTNALLVANNLFLDRTDPGIQSAANGNIYFTPVADPNIPGIRFDSPVFVNGNIYVLPTDAPAYSPVTFGDKVIIGAGMVLQGDGAAALYSKPKSAGGSDDRFYSQAKNFGGFLKGILLDPGPDEGLKVLAQVEKPAGDVENDAALCILRNAAKTDLTLTRDSQLFLRVNKAEEAVAKSTYQFTANLGRLNNFYKQSISGSTQFKNFTPVAASPEIAYTGTAAEQRPIMRLAVALNGWAGTPNAFVTADLSSRATMKIPMNPNDPGAYILVTTSPYKVGENFQNNAVNIQVELFNQDKFALVPYPVKPPGSSIATTSEPSIDFNIEAFDVAYTTKKTEVSSERKKGMNAGDIPCPAGSPGHNQIGVVDGQTYHCWPEYQWHPAMGKYKANGFHLRRPHGSADPVFRIQRQVGATSPAGAYLGCSALNAACPFYDEENSPKEEKDWVAFDNSCFTPPSGTDMFPSFGAADWANTSFTEQARRSWGFTEPGTPEKPGYNAGTLPLNATNARFDGATKPTFIVSAIHKTCRIEESANFVTGFFVCDELIVNPRTTPLRIIGTFIVAKMQIDPSAMKYGIRWSNIYYPTAVYELRRAGILNSSNSGENCDLPEEPLWHPYPSVKRTQHLFKCNPISLRNKADPFKWTMVDPDCGLVDNKQQCRYRTMRFDIIELKRQEFL